MRGQRELPPNFPTHEYGGGSPPFWMVLPAYTVLPFIRYPLGYEIVNARSVICRAIALIVFPVMAENLIYGFHPPAGLGHVYLSLFALTYLVTACILFARRWQGQKRGERRHTSESGYSWLVWYTFLPVPLCEIVLVPAALWFFGRLIDNTISRELGWWLMLSAISLGYMGVWEYFRIWTQQRAATDDLVRAEQFEARVAKSNPNPAGASSGRTSEPDFADLA